MYTVTALLLNCVYVGLCIDRLLQRISRSQLYTRLNYKIAAHIAAVQLSQFIVTCYSSLVFCSSCVSIRHILYCYIICITMTIFMLGDTQSLVLFTPEFWAFSPTIGIHSYFDANRQRGFKLTPPSIGADNKRCASLAAEAGGYLRLQGSGPDRSVSNFTPPGLTTIVVPVSQHRLGSTCGCNARVLCIHQLRSLSRLALG